MFDQQQWGWGYQILPYVEQQALWNTTSDEVVTSTPLSLYFCPARRPPVVLLGGPWQWRPYATAMCDYAGNAGTDEQSPGCGYLGTGVDGVIMLLGSGVCNYRDITDGASNTIAVGEKLLNGNFTMTAEPNDNDGFVAGLEDDTVRWGSWNASNPNDPNNVGPPIADFHTLQLGMTGGPPLMPNNYRFGSAHAAGANFTFCDGAVRLIHYSVDPEIFRRACCRNDGLTFSADAL